MIKDFFIFGKMDSSHSIVIFRQTIFQTQGIRQDLSGKIQAVQSLLEELERLELIDTCRSRVASVMTFPCIRQWTAADGSTVSNPFTHTNKGEG